jgi:hypothetical protein
MVCKAERGIDMTAWLTATCGLTVAVGGATGPAGLAADHGGRRGAPLRGRGRPNPIIVDARGDRFALPATAARTLTARRGRMTGVTRAARERAAARGDYFPLREFRLSPADVAAVRARAGQ